MIVKIKSCKIKLKLFISYVSWRRGDIDIKKKVENCHIKRDCP